METTAVRMNKALEVRGMKRIELSEKTGICRGTISNYANGKYIPKQNAIYLIAKALNVSEAWLMGYDVDMEKHESLSVLISKLDNADYQKVQGYVEALLSADKYASKKDVG